MKAALALALILCGLACEGGRTEHPYPPRTGGSAERGEDLIRSYGCGACHTIPGVEGARGEVGPPLSFFQRRTFIAGQVPNTPRHLVRWLMDPHAIEPDTAMPTLGLTVQEARDVAAYLYTLD